MAKKTLHPSHGGPYMWKGKFYNPGDEVPEEFPDHLTKEADPKAEPAPQGTFPGSANSGVELDEAHQVPTPVRAADSGEKAESGKKAKK